MRKPELAFINADKPEIENNLITALEVLKDNRELNAIDVAYLMVDNIVMLYQHMAIKFDRKDEIINAFVSAGGSRDDANIRMNWPETNPLYEDDNNEMLKEVALSKKTTIKPYSYGSIDQKNKDLKWIAGIWGHWSKKHIMSPPSYQDISRRMDNNECIISKAGFSLFKVYKLKSKVGTAKIEKIAVDSNEKGTGQGYELLDSTLEYFKSKNVNTVSLDVEPENYNAINFYEKNGFRKIGTRLKGNTKKIELDVMERKLA
jgi:GNAT superfamily N-acetyltransferase